jgi:hypothetical protein
MADKYEFGQEKLKYFMGGDSPVKRDPKYVESDMQGGMGMAEHISDAVPRRQSGGTPEQAVSTTHRSVADEMMKMDSGSAVDRYKNMLEKMKN